MSEQRGTSQVQLPMLPMREDIIYPGMTVPFFIGRKQSMEAVERALDSDRRIFVVTQRDTSVERPEQKDLFDVGTVGNILQIMRLPNGTLKALFEAKSRGRLIHAELDQDHYAATVEMLPSVKDDSEPIRELAEKIRDVARTYIKDNKKNAEEIDLDGLLASPPDELADKLAPLLNSSRDVKQQILEVLDPLKRLEQVFSEMEEESEVRKLEKKLKEQVRQSIGTTHREGFLQDQLKAIQKELGQGDDARDDFEEFERQIKEANMPEAVAEVAKKELKKLRLMSPMSAEANVGRNYLDWLISLPWSVRTEDNFDLEKAQEVLDEDHYGMEKVKEQIIEYLAVSKLKGQLKGPILCFVGPPGVGKTSLAKSIARAVGRNFARMSLGGIRDEAEIRGHRRTYIGALPGKIIQAARKAKSRNPVILMDEIDKLYTSIMGDPSAALLEVLDPEQNRYFMDHYIEVEYDLSESLFICTANSTQNITPPLLDRMEVIQLPGYTELEKIQIAQRHLLPKQQQEHGLDDTDVALRRDALVEVIGSYTREAGVRGLEREIGKILRKVVTQLVKDTKQKKGGVTITAKGVSKYLGLPKYHHTEADDSDQVGITNGLAVTAGGGELLITEVETMPGTGRRVVTGQLGDVMKESAEIAFSYIRGKADSLGVMTSDMKQRDIHVHLPENALPKDGPSAGVTLVTSLASALTGIPVRRDVAMTGEVTLRGLVLQIGGLKEKLLAAKRHGMKEVLIPQENEKDLADVPDEIKKQMKITPVERLDQVLKVALSREPVPLTQAQREEDQRRITEMHETNRPPADTPTEDTPVAPM